MSDGGLTRSAADVQYDLSIADGTLTVSLSYPPYKSIEG